MIRASLVLLEASRAGRPVRSRERAVRCCVVALIAALAGCARLPPQPTQIAPETHFSAGSATRLGQLAATRGLPEGLSGVRVLDTGRDAFLERTALIESAERAIDLQYYIWNSDATGIYLAHRLYALPGAACACACCSTTSTWRGATRRSRCSTRTRTSRSASTTPSRGVTGSGAR
jgi:putative cardiolipin synthase